MSYFSRLPGAAMSLLGAVLVLCGALFPSGNADYARNVPFWWLLAWLIAPALLALVSSLFAWFRPLPRWLVIVSLVVSLLAFAGHLFWSQLVVAFACFDICPAAGVHVGTGFWLPLLGFLLSIIGLVNAAMKRSPRTPSE